MIARHQVLTSLRDARSIAVVGASDDPLRHAGRPIHNLQALGYAGRIIPVNRRRDEVQGLPAFPSLDDVEGEIDVVELVTPAAAVHAELERCAESGVRLVVVSSSGFAETGDTAAEARIAELCAGTPMRVVGPNALGVFCTATGAAATIAPAIAEPQPVGNIGLVSQSGAVGMYGYTAMRRAGLACSFVACTGNEIDVSVGELLGELAVLPEVEVLVAYLEAINDFDSFAAAARLAAANGKALIALKAGRTEAGGRAAQSHTSSLAGSDRTITAALESLGVIRVPHLEAMVDAATAFSLDRRRPTGRRLTVMSPSGGCAVMTADAAEDLGFSVPTWAPEWRKRLSELIPGYGATSNPIDLTGSNALRADGLLPALRLALDYPGTDAVAVSLGGWDDDPKWLPDVLAARETSTTPLAVCWIGSEESRRRFADAGVAAYATPERTIAALDALVRAPRSEADVHALPAEAPLPAGVGEIFDRAVAAGQERLDERDSAQVLRAFGVDIVAGEVVHTSAEAVAAAARIDGPVALKLLSVDHPHKTDIGGVALGLVESSAVVDAAEAILAIAEGRGAVLVQPMVPPGTELILGATIDASVGPVVLVGFGGVFTEVLDDVAMGLAPVDRARARSLIASLRGAPVLDGVRGATPCDTESIAGNVAAVALAAHALRDRIRSIDVNPLICSPTGSVAADCLIELASPLDKD